MTEIAVVMAAYIPDQDHLNWLGEAIDSVFRSTFADRELVVVDDASPVDLAPHLTGLPLRYLRMINHGGPAAARNSAVAATSARYIFCLDADDRIKPDGLERLYGGREDNRYVYGDLDFIGARTGTKQIPDWSLDELRTIRGPIGITALQPRALWQALGGWREDLKGLEDIEYWIRAARRGIIGKRIPGAIFDYRIHPGSRTAGFRRDGIGEQMVEAVRQLHLDFLETQPSRRDRPMNGRVEVLYVGPRVAGFHMQGGSPSGTKYYVDGRNSRMWVDARDVEWLLDWKDAGGQAFRVIMPEPIIQPIIQPAIDFSALPAVATEVPDVTTMNAKDASEAVSRIDNEPDLRVVEALENGTQKRKTVLKAIEDRRKELVVGG